MFYIRLKVEQFRGMPLGAIPFPFGICRICRDKATGLHYGVATCEGCKVGSLSLLLCTHLFFVTDVKKLTVFVWNELIFS